MPTPQPTHTQSLTPTPAPSQTTSDPWNDAVKAAAKGQPAATDDEGKMPKVIQDAIDAEPPDAPEPDDNDVPVEPQDEPPAEPQEPEPDKPTEPAKADANSPFDKDDEPFTKQMSKQSRTHFAEKLSSLKAAVAEKDTALAAANKELEVSQGKRLPDAWFSQPGAHQASPQYQEAVKNFNNAQGATNFWTAQLRALKSGQDYQMLTPDGKPYTVKADQADPAHEIDLQTARTEAYEAQKHWANIGNAIESNFATGYQMADARTTDFIKRELPWFFDDKAPEQAFVKKATEGMRQLTGLSYRNFDRNMAIATLALREVDKAKYEKEIEGLKTKLASFTDKRKAGPAGGRRGAPAPTTDGDKKMTMDDFKL